MLVSGIHGNGDGAGNSYLVLLPDPVVGHTPGERAGQYWDRELAADLAMQGRNRARVFVTLDACFSGGLIEEVVSSLPWVVGTTTCSRKGYGYDRAPLLFPWESHGKWGRGVGNRSQGRSRATRGSSVTARGRRPSWSSI